MTGNLIVYYSRKGENYFGGSIRDIPKGNTEYIAEYIASAVGGDLFEVDTAESYPSDYMECTEVAKRELRQGARPELKRYLDSIDGYDNVFVCGPCWWGTYPMAVFTLLERLDWRGKRVFAVMTHEGSGMGSSERDLKNACKGAVLAGSLAISGSQAQSSEKKAADWARSCLGRYHGMRGIQSRHEGDDPRGRA